jgi:hypothetical protein
MGRRKDGILGSRKGKKLTSDAREQGFSHSKTDDEVKTVIKSPLEIIVMEWNLMMRMKMWSY